jgi:carbon-monoxide dehydrogenase large subunit
MMKFGIGQAITRREDDRLLTGKACYVDDVRAPGALHAMFVRSPRARARCRDRCQRALATAGVVAVLTGADLEADGVRAFPPNPMLKPDAEKSVTLSRFLLSLSASCVSSASRSRWCSRNRKRSRARGEPRADRYDALPAVASLDAALAPSAPCVWPGTGQRRRQGVHGDRAACEKAFAQRRIASPSRSITSGCAGDARTARLRRAV